MQMQSNGLPFSKMGKTRLHHAWLLGTAGCTIRVKGLWWGGAFTQRNWGLPPTTPWAQRSPPITCSTMSHKLICCNFVMQMQSNGLPFSKMGKTRLHHASPAFKPCLPIWLRMISDCTQACQSCRVTSWRIITYVAFSRNSCYPKQCTNFFLYVIYFFYHFCYYARMSTWRSDCTSDCIVVNIRHQLSARKEWFPLS